MMSLRALGNTGHAEAVVPSLYNCIERQDNSMDIRIAAIQAFRRLDCAADVRQLSRDLLKYRNIIFKRSLHKINLSCTPFNEG